MKGDRDENESKVSVSPRCPRCAGAQGGYKPVRFHGVGEGVGLRDREPPPHPCWSPAESMLAKRRSDFLFPRVREVHTHTHCEKAHENAFLFSKHMSAQSPSQAP